MGKENREKTLRAFKRARKVIAKFTNTYSISPALEKIAELSKKRINLALQDLFDPDAPEEKKAKSEDLIFSTYFATQPRRPGPAREFPPEVFDWLYDLCADVAERQLKKYREQRGAAKEILRKFTPCPRKAFVQEFYKWDSRKSWTIKTRGSRGTH